MDVGAFEAAPKSLISDFITEQIEKAITSGSLRPGQKLALKALAETFKVSMIPVRDALNRLAAAGLVVRKPNRGVFVVELTLVEMGSILEVRVPLEGTAARLAAHRAKPNEIRALRNVVLQMSDSLQQRDFVKYSQTDLVFHRTLWKCSKNSFLEKALSTLMLPWFGFQLASGLLSSEANYAQIPALHDQITSAIEARDGARAERAIATLSCCAQEYIAKEKREDNERRRDFRSESSSRS